jgi:hypothetical protein
MDPQATWEEMLRALAGGDWDDLETHARSLQDWIVKGGFPPAITGPHDVWLICQMALDFVERLRL